MALKSDYIILAAEVATAATRTAEPNQDPSARGVAIRVNIANRVAGSFTPSVEWRTVSGIFLPIWIAAAAIVTDGDFLYLLYPGVVGGSFLETIRITIPQHWRVVLTRNAGTADTLVEGASLN